jgi:hypothetical protein
MKLPLFLGVAFVVGLAGGTGVGVMTAPKPAAVAAADSTKAGAGRGATGHEAGTAYDAAVASASGQAPVPVTSDSAGAHDAGYEAASGAHEASDAPAEVGPVALQSLPRELVAGATKTHAPEDFQQVARILTTMKPTDAAKILAFLGDDHVEGIIRAVGPRQAAVLMVQIPAQRAALLSRRLIQNPTPEKK